MIITRPWSVSARGHFGRPRRRLPQCSSCGSPAFTDNKTAGSPAGTICVLLVVVGHRRLHDQHDHRDAGGRRPALEDHGEAPSVPLTRSSVHALLRDDYYVGVVTFDGIKNPNGEHPKFIDQATFDLVQKLLDAHRIGGNRSRKYEHYLCD